MTLYLDTSALVKLYVDEEGSELVREGVEEARFVSTSAIAYVEARAAFARRRSERTLTRPAHRRVIDLLDADWPRYMLLDVTDAVIREAARLTDLHGLRAYDAIHLASAGAVRERFPEGVVFASWDARLDAAASREGLSPLRHR
ncbi:MAG: type II toxin-antitoxin system VapC family toxin [Candidatus Rokuibacteriota bacterium]